MGEKRARLEGRGTSRWEEEGAGRGAGRVMDGRRKEWWVGVGVWGGQGGEGSHLPSIFTGSELLNWELELERVPETLQIQLHLLDIG